MSGCWLNNNWEILQKDSSGKKTQRNQNWEIKWSNLLAEQVWANNEFFRMLWSHKGIWGSGSRAPPKLTASSGKMLTLSRYNILNNSKVSAHYGVLLKMSSKKRAKRNFPFSYGVYFLFLRWADCWNISGLLAQLLLFSGRASGVVNGG